LGQTQVTDAELVKEKRQKGGGEGRKNGKSGKDMRNAKKSSENGKTHSRKRKGHTGKACQTTVGGETEKKKAKKGRLQKERPRQLVGAPKSRTFENIYYLGARGKRARGGIMCTKRPVGL